MDPKSVPLNDRLDKIAVILRNVGPSAFEHDVGDKTISNDQGVYGS
jgi:hypothetical protein